MFDDVCLFTLIIPSCFTTISSPPTPVSLSCALPFSCGCVNCSLQELIVRLTDENDPFFLFNLALGEEDFQGYADDLCDPHAYL